MKMNTRVVMDMTQEGCPVIEEESYDYYGPVAQCLVASALSFGTYKGAQGIGKSISRSVDQFLDAEGDPSKQIARLLFPQPIGDEAALEQFEIGQFASLAEFQNFQLGQMGFRFGAEGQIEEIPEAELTQRQRDIRAFERADLAQLQGAVAGDVFSPQFEERAEQLTEAQRVELLRGAGPASTAGAQQTAALQSNIIQAREALRQGVIEKGAARLQGRQELRQTAITDLGQQQLGALSATGDALTRRAAERQAEAQFIIDRAALISGQFSARRQEELQLAGLVSQQFSQ
jgi:hypothetical protein